MRIFTKFRKKNCKLSTDVCYIFCALRCSIQQKTSGSQTVITKTTRIQVKRKTEGHIDNHHKDMKLIVAEKKKKKERKNAFNQ